MMKTAFQETHTMRDIEVRMDRRAWWRDLGTLALSGMCPSNSSPQALRNPEEDETEIL